MPSTASSLPLPLPLRSMEPPLLTFLLSSLLTPSLLLLLLTSSSSSSRKRKRKRLHQLPQQLPPSNPDHFPLFFRVSSSTFQFLSGLLDPLLNPNPNPYHHNSHSLPSQTLLALALFRLASGASYPSIAAAFRVPAVAPRFASRRLRRVLLANFRFWLSFPTAASSGCRGAVACARFPGRTGPVAAQFVADASCRILSVSAGFRGTRSDFEVLRLSSLYADLEQGRILDSNSNQYLVGDGSGYPLLPWLMVPFAGPVAPESPEARFNAEHVALCRPVRRAVRSLGGWGAIARLDEEEGPRAVAACIGTCAMLHNVLLTREDYSAVSPEEEDEGESGPAEGRSDKAEVAGFEVDSHAVAMRNALAARMVHAGAVEPAST